METLIVHDGRLPGGFGAIVLARLLRRAGHSAQVSHLDAATGADQFWNQEIRNISTYIDNLVDTKLILMGITFYDVDPQVSIDAIASLTQEFGNVEIWSHRWPDGYSRDIAGFNTEISHIKIPPDDIVYGPLGVDLRADEKNLLRLSLVAAHAVPVVEEDDLTVRALQQWLREDADNNWNKMLETASLAESIKEAKSVRVQDPQDESARIVQNHTEKTGFAEVEIPERSAVNEISILDSLGDVHDIPRDAIFLVWLGDGRILLHRRNSDQHKFPSIRWLLNERLNSDLDETLQDRYYGPQDSVYFRVDNLAAQRPRLALHLRQIAEELAHIHSGGRYITAALGRDLCDLANKILDSVDMQGKYTSPEGRQISVRADDVYELIHTSSRTGEPRRTLTMPIEVLTPEATAFLFRDGGYNLQKVERLLEGAVVGLAMRHLDWLGTPSLPNRLRIDVCPVLGYDPERFLTSVRQSLHTATMAPLAAEEKYVKKNSLIGRALEISGMSRLVCFAESETIGPSVAHALTLLATAETVKSYREGGRGATVLDLFAGSGIANRLLSRSGHLVTSVDMFVSATSVGLDSSDRDGLWLQADARRVIDSINPIIEQRFDVIGLDPPHAELLDLLFGSADGRQSLVELCHERADVLIMYQGHSTQRGRLSLVDHGLRQAKWSHVTILHVEEELIVVAISDSINDEAAERLVEGIVQNLRQIIHAKGLPQIDIWRVASDSLSL